jgi:hypothetical protein
MARQDCDRSRASDAIPGADHQDSSRLAALPFGAQSGIDKRLRTGKSDGKKHCHAGERHDCGDARDFHGGPQCSFHCLHSRSNTPRLQGGGWSACETNHILTESKLADESDDNTGIDVSAVLHQDTGQHAGDRRPDLMCHAGGIDLDQWLAASQLPPATSEGLRAYHPGSDNPTVAADSLNSLGSRQ